MVHDSLSVLKREERRADQQRIAEEEVETELYFLATGYWISIVGRDEDYVR